MSDMLHSAQTPFAFILELCPFLFTALLQHHRKTVFSFLGPRKLQKSYSPEKKVLHFLSAPPETS